MLIHCVEPNIDLVKENYWLLEFQNITLLIAVLAIDQSFNLNAGITYVFQKAVILTDSQPAITNHHNPNHSLEWEDLRPQKCQ